MSFDDILSSLRSSFSSGKLRTIQKRKAVLYNIWKLINDNEQLLLDSINKDYCKSDFEFTLFEIKSVLSEIRDAAQNLEKWCSPKSVSKNFVNFFNTCDLIPEPLGVILIISPWNFPLNLSIKPLVGAISAGNCAILKPSELVPNFSNSLKELFDKYVDKEIVNVLLGDKNVTSQLLELRFDHIFFTGSTEVGKIVMRCASKYLTPVTLELGGKCPVYVDKTSDLESTTSKLSWGKAINCGQLCVSPDYVLCHSQVFEDFLNLIKKAFENQWKNDLLNNKYYGRIVNESHCKRIKNLIDNTSGTIIYGGQVIMEEKFIEPTVIKVHDYSDLTMGCEIFGPVLIIKSVEDHNEAISYINKNEKPLALYVFSSNNKIIDQFKKETSSGSLVINDIFNQMTIPAMPFGGVGHSGMGAYNSYYTFQTFSHFKPLFIKRSFLKSLDEIIYPPITPFKQKVIYSSLDTSFPGRRYSFYTVNKAKASSFLALLIILAAFFFHNSKKF